MGISRIFIHKEPIRVLLIFWRWPLKAFTEWTLTASLGRLFHVVITVLEKNLCRSSSLLWSLFNLNECPRVRESASRLKNVSNGTADSPWHTLKTSIRSAQFLLILINPYSINLVMTYVPGVDGFCFDIINGQTGMKRCVTNRSINWQIGNRLKWLLIGYWLAVPSHCLQKNKWLKLLKMYIFYSDKYSSTKLTLKLTRTIYQVMNAIK